MPAQRKNVGRSDLPLAIVETDRASEHPGGLRGAQRLERDGIEAAAANPCGRGVEEAMRQHRFSVLDFGFCSQMRNPGRCTPIGNRKLKSDNYEDWPGPARLFEDRWCGTISASVRRRRRRGRTRLSPL